MDKKVVKRGLLPYLFIALFMLGMFYMFNVMNKEVNVLTYDEFVENLDGGKLKELEIVARTSGYTYEATGVLKDYDDGETFFARLPLS